MILLKNDDGTKFNPSKISNVIGVENNNKNTNINKKNISNNGKNSDSSGSDSKYPFLKLFKKIYKNIRTGDNVAEEIFTEFGVSFDEFISVQPE